MKIAAESVRGDLREQLLAGHAVRIGVYAVTAVLLFGLHWNMRILSDDEIFSQVLNEMSFFEHMKQYYFSGSGKFLTDSLSAVVSHIPMSFFRILNTAVMLMIAWCINRLFTKDGNGVIEGCIAVLLLPFGFLSSAGYATTSANYVWTSAALLLALYPLRHGASMPLFARVLSCIAAVYACNQEQAGAVLVVGSLLCIVYRKLKGKRIYGIQIAVWLLGLMSLIALMTAPGHRMRISGSHIGMFALPDYLMLSFTEKLARGITSTMAVLIAGQDIIWIAFCAMMFMAVVAKGKHRAIQVFSAVPFVVSLFLFQGFPISGILPQRLRELFVYRPANSFGMWDFRPIDASTYTGQSFYVPIFLSLITAGILLIAPFLILGVKDSRSWLLFVTFSAGLCSRIMMGFSSSLYGSSFRTFIYLYYALGACVAVLRGVIQEQNHGRKRNFTAITVDVGLLLCVIYTVYFSFASVYEMYMYYLSIHGLE